LGGAESAPSVPAATGFPYRPYLLGFRWAGTTATDGITLER